MTGASRPRARSDLQDQDCFYFGFVLRPPKSQTTSLAPVMGVVEKYSYMYMRISDGSQPNEKQQKAIYLPVVFF